MHKFFTAFDKSGTNTKKYKNLFTPMSDAQFKKYFTDLFADDKAYLILDIVDYDRAIKMEDIDYTEKIATFNLLVGNNNEEVALNYLTLANWDETKAAMLYNQENKGAEAKLQSNINAPINPMYPYKGQRFVKYYKRKREKNGVEIEVDADDTASTDGKRRSEVGCDESLA